MIVGIEEKEMLPSGFANNRYIINADKLIEKAIDNYSINKDSVLCDYLHGTKMSTLLSMLSSNIKDEFKGCLLSKNKANEIGALVKTGNCMTLFDGESDYLNGGSMVSLASYHDEDIARHYAVSPNYNDRSGGHIPPIVFGIKAQVNEEPVLRTFSRKVIIEAMDNHICIDHQVPSHIPANNISAIFLRDDNVSEVSRVVEGTNLQHVRIIGTEL